MPCTKREAVAVVGILYLLIPLALGSYALHIVRTQSLPIPKTLSAFTLALPAAAPLVLQPMLSSQDKEWRVGKFKVAFLRILSPIILLVYESAIASLIGTHLGPSQNLRCGLDDRWRSLYHYKDGEAVRKIQDAFQCCGLHSVLDMAWPFPGAGIDPGACQRNYARNSSCFESWRGQEQRVAGLMLATVVLVFFWKALATWLWFHGLQFRPFPQHVHSHEEDRLGRTNTRALGYRDNNNQYSDEPIHDQSSANSEEDHEDRVSDDAQDLRLLL